MKTDRHDGGLAIYRQGAGAPLLLIHGVGLNASCWSAQMEDLSRTAQAVAVDLPGHGNSPLCGDGLQYLDIACEALERVMRTEFGQPAIVVGHSLGAMIALEFASRHRSEVRGVVAMSAVFERSAEAMSAVAARAAQLQENPDSDSLNEATLTRWFGGSPAGEMHRLTGRCREWLSSTNRAAYAAAYNVFAKSNGASRELLGALTMPSLFITGSDDPNSTPQMSKAMANIAPQGKAAIVEGARHMLQLTHAASVNALIAHFIQHCERHD